MIARAALVPIVLALLAGGSLVRAGVATTTTTTAIAPVALDQTLYSVSEQDERVVVTVHRVLHAGAAPEDDDRATVLEMLVDVYEGTAIEGFDFQPTKNLLVTLAPGTDTATIAIPVYDNTWRDGKRILEVVLHDVDDAWRLSALVEIIDDETTADENPHAQQDDDGDLLKTTRLRRADSEVVFFPTVIVNSPTPTATPSATSSPTTPPTNAPTNAPTGVPTTSSFTPAIEPSGTYSFRVNTASQNLVVPARGSWPTASVTCRFTVGGTNYDTTGTVVTAPLSVTCPVPSLSATGSGTMRVSVDGGQTFVTGTASVQFVAVAQFATRFRRSAAQIQVVYAGSAGSSGSSVPCSTLLDASTVAKLGTGATCDLTAESLLTVTLTPDATIKPQDDMVLLGLTSGASASSVIVQGPVAPVVPVVVMTAPSVHPSCAPLVVDASASYNHGGRALTYNWNILPPTLSVTNFISTIFSASKKMPVLTVPVGVLDGGTTYTFALSVTNWLGQTSSISQIKVQVTTAPVAVVHIDGPTSIPRDQPLTLHAIAESSPCSATELLTFQWDVPLGVDVRGATTSTLVVSPYSLRPGTTYAFTVASTGSSGNPTSASIFVTARSNPLGVHVVGGYERSVGANDAVNLTVSVLDPDRLGRLAQVGVACTMPLQSGSPCPFSTTAGTTLQPPSDGTAAFFTTNVAGGALASGAQYLFTFVVSDNLVNSTQSITTVTALLVVANDTQVGVMLNGDLLVSPGEPMRVVASLAQASVSPSSLRFTWRTLSGSEPSEELGAYPYSTLDLSGSAMADGTLLRIDGAKIKPLQVYHVRVDVYVPGAQDRWLGYAQWRVQVKSAPSSGTLTVAPVVAGANTAAISPFAMQAAWWTTEPGAQPLRYSFTAAYDPLPRRMLLLDSYSRMRTAVLPMDTGGTSSITVAVVVTQRDGAQASQSLSVAVAPCTSNVTDVVDTLKAAIAAVSARQDWQQLMALITGAASCAAAKKAELDGNAVASLVQTAASTIAATAQPLASSADAISSTCALDAILATTPLVAPSVGTLTTMFAMLAANGAAVKASGLISASTLSRYASCLQRVSSTAAQFFASVSGVGTPGLVQNVEAAFTSLSDMYLATRFCNEPAVQLGSGSSLVSLASARTSYAGKSLTMPGTGRSLTFGSSNIGGANCVCVSSIVLPPQMYAFVRPSWQFAAGSTVVVATPPTSIRMQGCSQVFGGPLPVPDAPITDLAASPLGISFSWAPPFTGPGNATLTCAFYDNTTALWSTSGVSSSGTTLTGAACRTNHLTDFAVVAVLPPSDAVGTPTSAASSASGFPGWAIAVIVVGSLLLLALIALIIFLILRRRRRARRAAEPREDAPEMAQVGSGAVMVEPRAPAEDASLSNIDSQAPLTTNMSDLRENLTLLTMRPPAYAYPPSYDTHQATLSTQRIASAIAPANNFDQVALNKMRVRVRPPPVVSTATSASTSDAGSLDKQIPLRAAAAPAHSDDGVSTDDDDDGDDDGDDKGEETALETDTDLELSSTVLAEQTPAAPPPTGKGKARAVATSPDAPSLARKAAV